MKSHWERGAQFLALELDTLTALIEPAFPGRRVEDARPAEGGLSNTNYRLMLSGRTAPVSIRLYVTRPQSARVELAVSRYVRHRIPVPEVLFFAESNPFTGHPYAVLEWLDGIMLDALPTAHGPQAVLEIAPQLGELLAVIGSFQFSTAGFLNETLQVSTPMNLTGDTFLTYIHHDLFAGQAGERLGDELARSLWRFATRGAVLLDGLTLTPCLAHGDLDGTNIIVQKTDNGWMISGLVDWEYALSATSLLDLGHILRPPFGDDDLFERRLIDGFLRHGGSLPPEWKRAMLLIDLINWVSFLNRPSAGPNVVDWSRAMIARTMENW
jgi:aminoglycoside phosphotransferase (APT) family kinase protein